MQDMIPLDAVVNDMLNDMGWDVKRCMRYGRKCRIEFDDYARV